MANNYKVAMINDCGLINVDFGDSIFDVKVDRTDLTVWV